MSYAYLAHRRNYTWLNERAVEVPIARAAVDAAEGRVLEVGNVLGHYVPVSHVVLDRYEQAPRRDNADVLEFEDEGGFDLIVSVSTLEHVGWDERPRDPSAAERAFAHLRGLLAPGGSLVVTLPVGSNRVLDEAIRGGRLELSELRALAARSGATSGARWIQPRSDSALRLPAVHAHGIVVCHARGRESTEPPGPGSGRTPRD